MIRNLLLATMLSGSVATTTLNVDLRDNTPLTFNTEIANESNISYSTDVDQINKSYQVVGRQSVSGVAFNTSLRRTSLVYLDPNDIDYYNYNDDVNMEYYVFTIETNKTINSCRLTGNINYNLIVNPDYPYWDTETWIITTQNVNIVNAINDLTINDRYNMVLSDIESGRYGYNYTVNQIYTTNNQHNQTQLNTQINIIQNSTTYLIIACKLNKWDGETIETNWSLPQNLTEIDTNLTLSGSYSLTPGVQEIIDVPSIMFYVLTMPFTFISQAFNLTLFPGTPYELNISNLFLTIIGVMIFAWILSLIIKKGK